MIWRMMTSLVALAMMAVVLAGCERGEEPPSPAPVDPAVMDREEPAMMDRIERPQLEDAIALAKADLAGRLDQPEPAIEIDEAREVTWRDGALGCPEPDMMYTQALVEGFFIRLVFAGESYAYHAGRDGVPFLCPAERSQPPLERPAAPRE